MSSSQWFNPEKIHEVIAYLEETTEESWCVDVVRTEDQRNCLFGHLFELGGSELCNVFESMYACDQMVYPVNDGNHPKYQQPTPKQRCLAYVRDLASGIEPTTMELMDAEARRRGWV